MRDLGLDEKKGQKEKGSDRIDDGLENDGGPDAVASLVYPAGAQVEGQLAQIPDNALRQFHVRTQPGGQQGQDGDQGDGQIPPPGAILGKGCKEYGVIQTAGGDGGGENQKQDGHRVLPQGEDGIGLVKIFRYGVKENEGINSAEEDPIHQKGKDHDPKNQQALNDGGFALLGIDLNIQTGIGQEGAEQESHREEIEQPEDYVIYAVKINSIGDQGPEVYKKGQHPQKEYPVSRAQRDLLALRDLGHGGEEFA